jgi:hypothetical protein
VYGARWVTLTEPHVFLIGRPPIEEYLAFLTQAAAGESVDLQLAVGEWRKAADVVDHLLVTEAGAADGQDVGTVPPALQGSVQKFLNDPVVANTYAVLAPSIGLVELDRLVVYQRQINKTYASRLRSSIKKWRRDSTGLLNFCLSLNQSRPPLSRLQANQNTFVFRSPSSDARFLGATMLDASQITGYTPQGYAHSAVVLFIGYGPNALSVVVVNGRLILNNGSHRAYALREAGFTHAWAVVQKVVRQEDLTILPTVQQNLALYVQSPRPPMLKDYFNPTLRKVINVPTKVREIKVQYGVEALDAPA